MHFGTDAERAMGKIKEVIDSTFAEHNLLFAHERLDSQDVPRVDVLKIIMPFIGSDSFQLWDKQMTKVVDFNRIGILRVGTLAPHYLTQLMKGTNHKDNPHLIEEAKKHPNGWVYVIDEQFRGEIEVPPEHISGAWKVNGSGEIVGKFVPNPKYKRRNNA